MHQVYRINMGPDRSRPLHDRENVNSGLLSSELGVIEKIIDSGKFLLTLENGQKVEALGSPTLQIGSKVQVSLTQEMKNAPRVQWGDEAAVSGLQWSAFIPVWYKGVETKVQLKVYVDGKTRPNFDKNKQAVYFVLQVEATEVGTIQWNLYLKDRNVSLQVYCETLDRKNLVKLVRETEKALRSRGYQLATPTVFLKKQLKPPAHFRLNVKG